MPGRPNRGMLKGKRPKNARPPFKAGEASTIEAAKKGGQARREKCARFKSLREAAEALRDLPCTVKGMDKFTNGVAAVLSMYEEAARGNPKAFHELAAVMGELEEKISVEQLPTLVDDVPRAPDPPKN